MLTKKQSFKETAISCGIILVLALVVSVVIYSTYKRTYQSGVKAGTQAEASRWLTENARILKANKEKVEAATTINTQHHTETLLSERTATLERTDYEKKYNDLLNDINHGKYSVYISATPVPRATDANHHDTALTPTPAPATTQACRLDAKTVSDIANLTHDGDIAILERNECIERYQLLEKRLAELELLKGKVRNDAKDTTA